MCRQAHEYAFHSFCGQPDRGHGRYLTGGKPLAVAKPKNRAFSFLIFPGSDQHQDLVNLLQLETLAYRSKLSGSGVLGSACAGSEIASVWPAPRFAAMADLK